MRVNAYEWFLGLRILSDQYFVSIVTEHQTLYKRYMIF
jgi:hypothetical protein